MTFTPAKLWRDLRRRHVVRVTALYAAAAWLVVQVADVVTDEIPVPEWVMPGLVLIAVVGFPVTAILAWLFDIESKGVVRTSSRGVKSAAAVTVGLLAVGTAGFLWVINWTRGPADYTLGVLPFADRSDESVDLLNKPYEAGYRDPVYLRFVPMLDPVRHDPRFRDILGRIREDLQAMAARVKALEDASDPEWMHLVGRHFETQVALQVQ